MPRLLHLASGVVVSCSPETAALLGAEYTPAPDQAPANPEPRRGTRKTT